jgi:hypothetical protein
MTDGFSPSVLDIIEIGVLGQSPDPYEYQTENWSIDSSIQWRRTGSFSLSGLPNLVDHRDLWLPKYDNFIPSDRLHTTELRDCSDSLRLIHVSELTVQVQPKTYPRALFTHFGVSYDLAITDPPARNRFIKREPGRYQLGPAYLTISLGMPFADYVYKLVAAIIEDSHA